MLDLSNADVASPSLDQLGMRVLEALRSEWNWQSFLAIERQRNNRDEATLRVLAEAVEWLRHNGLIAGDPGQTAHAAFFITRLGEQALEGGPRFLGALRRMEGDVHLLVQEKARPQFLLGEYEQAVFVALKAVEVRVRKLGNFTDADIGVDLMNRAFNSKSGSLTDPSAVPGEQEGTRALFAGAYAVMRNPSGHREVDYDDINEAAEMVHTASLLMRILDRVEQRLNG